LLRPQLYTVDLYDPEVVSGQSGKIQMRAFFTEVKHLAVVEMHLERILIFGDHRAGTKDRVAKTFLMPEWFR